MYVRIQMIHASASESLSSVTIQMSCLFVSETGVSAIVELS